MNECSGTEQEMLRVMLNYKKLICRYLYGALRRHNGQLVHQDVALKTNNFVWVTLKLERDAGADGSR